MNLNKRIIKAMVAVLSLFIVLVIYLNYFIIFKSEEYAGTKYDHRSTNVIRGNIYDTTGEVLLAYSSGEGSDQKRIYPHSKLYAHTIGHSITGVSGSGLEKSYNKALTDKPEFLELLSSPDEAMEEKGQDMQLTLHHGLTEYVDKTISKVAGNNGANVVVMNPQTGEVYCAYTKDSFDPNPDAMNKKDSEFNKNSLFDAINESFYCGSVFKIITAAAAIDAGHEDYTTDDDGKTVVGGTEIKNDDGHAYGDNLNMRKAIVKSSNVYFAELSEKIGKKNMIKALNSFCITEKIPFEGLETVDSGLDIAQDGSGTVNLEECDTAAFAYASFGQTPVKLSPLHMALAAAGIANKDGNIMAPYMVKSLSRNGNPNYIAQQKVLSNACSARAARLVRSYMVDCIEEGTGSRAKISGFRYGGKTGTAQNGKGIKSHAWFVGFAPAENPQIAFCVMIENAGYGGPVCGPVVKDIVNYCRENGLVTG